MFLLIHHCCLSVNLLEVVITITLNAYIEHKVKVFYVDICALICSSINKD